METFFKNIFAAQSAEFQKDHEFFVTELNKLTTLEEMLNQWRFRDMLTPAKLRKAKSGDWTLAQVKEFLIAKSAKHTEKRTQEALADLITLEMAPTLESINVTVEWKRNRTWGSNPNVAARVRTDGANNTFYGSASGCGYDKESTAIAEAVNQSSAFRKAMYLHKEKHIKASNCDLFGYGSGYGILPRLEGGVGASCYPKIFGTIGFTFKNISSGKTFDVYEVRKLQTGEAPTKEPNQFSMLAAFSALADLTSGGDKAAANASKARMLKASVPAGALNMPSDWDTLSEEEKEKRLNGAIKVLAE